MKFLAIFTVFVCFHFAQNAVMDDLKDEFDSIEQDEAKINIEKEILAFSEEASKDVSNKEKELKNEVKAEKKDEKNANSVESQLEDLLQSTEEDDKSSKKDSLDQKQLHKILTTFENSDVIDKEKLLKAIEKFMKKDTISEDAASEDACLDVRKDCAYLARKGFCGTHKKTMEVKCAKTCNYCVDCKNLGGAQCKALKKRGYCESPKFSQRMKRLCFKECDYCRVPSPPKCSAAKYGCCWDKVTTMSDKVGTNCPVCEDKYRSVCETFQADCQRNNIAGRFMRAHCPKKCGNCGNKCADAVESALQCPWYARQGFCKTNKHAMKVLCQKTCQLC